jgi:hypothetical protein
MWDRFLVDHSDRRHEEVRVSWFVLAWVVLTLATGLLLGLVVLTQRAVVAARLRLERLQGQGPQGSSGPPDR